jgi:hypothetical protein
MSMTNDGQEHSTVPPASSGSDLSLRPWDELVRAESNQRLTVAVLELLNRTNDRKQIIWDILKLLKTYAGVNLASTCEKDRQGRTIKRCNDEAQVMQGDHLEIPQAFLHKPYQMKDL